jgi:hypothetical protein
MMGSEGDKLRDLAKRIKRGFKAAISDISPIADEIKLTIAESNQSQFDSEGGNLGGQWKPLAPSTIRERKRLGVGGEHPIGFVTGALRDYATDPANIDITISRSGKTLRVNFSGGSKEALIAKVFQKGNSKLGTPKRKILQVNDQGKSQIRKIFKTYIAKNVLESIRNK